jgi:rhamnogalacturonan endolyase
MFSYGQRQMENLDRGLVAVQVSKGVFVSWRIMGQEWNNTQYNL